MTKITLTGNDRNANAVYLHNKIMASGALAAQALLTMCKDLKTMRDENLYTELGYDDFGEYCDKAVGIGARQGYTYISVYEKLGSKAIEEHSDLGITKLSLLVQMNPVDRVEALENGDLGNMTTREVKELVEKSNAQSEQLSLMTTQQESLKTEKETLEEVIEKLKAENAELKSRPTEISSEPSPEKIEQLKAVLKEELKTDFENEKALAIQAEKLKLDKKIEKARSDAEKTAIRNKNKEIEAAVEKAKAEVRAESEDLRIALESFKAENCRLEKELKAADSEVQKVVIYFQSFQDSLNKTLAEINHINGEQKVKMLAAVKAALKQILTQMGE